MLTHQYLAVGDEQEATQTSVEVKELHKEKFCDLCKNSILSTTFKVAVSRFCAEVITPRLLLSVFPYTQNTPVEL